MAPQDTITQLVGAVRRVGREVPGVGHDGYRAHMVAEPETGLITDETLTMAAGAHNSDAAIAQKFLTPDEQAPDEQDGDEQDGAPSGDGHTEADPAPGVR